MISRLYAHKHVRTHVLPYQCWRRLGGAELFIWKGAIRAAGRKHSRRYQSNTHKYTRNQIVTHFYPTDFLVFIYSVHPPVTLILSVWFLGFFTSSRKFAVTGLKMIYRYEIKTLE